jgi:hypothetical protein
MTINFVSIVQAKQYLSNMNPYSCLKGLSYNDSISTKFTMAGLLSQSEVKRVNFNRRWKLIVWTNRARQVEFWYMPEQLVCLIDDFGVDIAAFAKRKGLAAQR